jgi:hypothetical protein
MADGRYSLVNGSMILIVMFDVIIQANLPLLQRELLQCAQMAKQTPQQYLHQHEQILHEREGPPLDTDELAPLEVNESGKRKAANDSTRYVFTWYT